MGLESQLVWLTLQTLMGTSRGLQLRLSFPFLIDCVLWGKVFGADLGLRPGCTTTFGMSLDKSLIFLFCNLQKNCYQE